MKTPEQETGDRRQATGDRQPASSGVLEKGADIAERLLALGVAALQLSEEFPKASAASHVALQLVRSATSAGANYEEARAAESRNDFVHKIGVAAKEVREANYWLALAQRSGWVQSDLSSVIRQAREAAAILGASVRTARAKRDL